MTQYKLGPNGAIMTSLNLFSTKFDQVLGLIEKRSTETDYVIIDTPGQIEVFTWSASGSIITETLATTLPTVSSLKLEMPKKVFVLNQFSGHFIRNGRRKMYFTCNIYE